MIRVAIIGANYFQRPLILKAKSLGYETHVFAWAQGAVGAEDADFFYPISIVEKRKILEVCKKIKPNAVVSIGSDLAAVTVNYLAEKLGLVGNSLEATKVSTNKYEMRKALKKAGIKVPVFEEYVLGQFDSLKEKIQYPVIVKPVDRSGSRGVTKVEKEDDLYQALTKACEESFEKKAIVEEFIDGEEYSCECISFKGKHHLLAVTKKFTTGLPHFIETGHVEPSGLEKKYLREIKEVIFKALDALGIYNGASHSEFKLNDAGIRVIEIGGRMGGDCIGSHLVQLSTGYDFTKMCLDVALGKEPIVQTGSEERIAAIKFIFNEKDYEQFEAIKNNHMSNIIEEYLEPLSERRNVQDSSSRWGYFIMQFNTVEELDKLELFEKD